MNTQQSYNFTSYLRAYSLLKMSGNIRHLHGNDNAKEIIFSHGARVPSGPVIPNFRGFKITLRHITFCKSLLDE